MKRILMVFMVTSALALMVRNAGSGEMRTVGLIENVRVDPGGLSFRAKLDTGADHCSVNAQSIHRFKRKGVRWVRFRLVDDEGRSIPFERKLVRVTKIKRAADKRQKRPVVMLTICLGTLSREVQVSLVDRTQFRNQMILGRSFMKGALLVNPSQSHTVEPQCAEGSTDSSPDAGGDAPR